jgi:hypothetical protein
MKYEIITKSETRPFNEQAEIIFAIMKLEEYLEENLYDDEVVGDYVLVDKMSLQKYLDLVRNKVTVAFTRKRVDKVGKYKTMKYALDLYNKTQEDEKEK